MSIFKDIGKAILDADAQGADVARHVMRQILEHPEIISLGRVSSPLAGRTTLRADREQLLARVSDLLRRGGTEDAERLICDLETAIGGPVFSAGGDFAFAFHATIPAGDVRSDRPILQFLDPAYSAAFTTRGVFPLPFDCREAHAGVRGSPASDLYLTHRHHGVEAARFPMEAFVGPFALAFERRYRPNELHEIELWATHPFHAPAPWSVGLMLSGGRPIP